MCAGVQRIKKKKKKRLITFAEEFQGGNYGVQYSDQGTILFVRLMINFFRGEIDVLMAVFVIMMLELILGEFWIVCVFCLFDSVGVGVFRRGCRLSQIRLLKVFSLKGREEHMILGVLAPIW